MWHQVTIARSCKILTLRRSAYGHMFNYFIKRCYCRKAFNRYPVNHVKCTFHAAFHRHQHHEVLVSTTHANFVICQSCCAWDIPAITSIQIDCSSICLHNRSYKVSRAPGLQFSKSTNALHICSSCWPSHSSSLLHSRSHFMIGWMCNKRPWDQNKSHWLSHVHLLKTQSIMKCEFEGAFGA